MSWDALYFAVVCQVASANSGIVSGMNPSRSLGDQAATTRGLSMSRRLAIVAVAMCIAATGSAFAQSPAQRDCEGPDPNAAIAACTAIVSAGKRVPPPAMIRALNQRGIAYVKLKDYDHAIADHTTAI